MNNNEVKHVYVKRPKDGVIIAIPEYTLEATLRQGFTIVEEIKPEPAEESVSDLACPLCDKAFKTERGLQTHKKAHK